MMKIECHLLSIAKIAGLNSGEHGSGVLHLLADAPPRQPVAQTFQLRRGPPVTEGEIEECLVIALGVETGFPQARQPVPERDRDHLLARRKVEGATMSTSASDNGP